MELKIINIMENFDLKLKILMASFPIISLNSHLLHEIEFHYNI